MTPFSRFSLALLVMATVAFGTASIASAQSDDDVLSNTERWYFHAHLGAQGQTISDTDTDGGGGLSGRVGYGVSPLATLYVGFDASGMTSEADGSQALFGGEYGLATFAFGSQFNFRRGKAWVPYFDAALFGIASVSDADGREVAITGDGIRVGGGVKYFVSPEFALDGGLYFSRGSYTEVEVDGETNDIDASFNNGRLAVGVSWYPFR